MKIDIIPGVLENNWPAIEQKIEKVKDFAKTIHVDLIDGKFAGNTTFLDPEPFKKYSGDIYFELHMMVVDPEKYIEPYANAGFKRFLGHIEHMENQTDFITRAKQFGEGGLAIDGPTSLSEISVPFSDLDSILVMDITAGFSGQKFNEIYLKKVEELRNKTSIPIEVDGGINDETIKGAFDAGATRFVATSFIYGHDNPSQQLNILLEKLGLTK